MRKTLNSIANIRTGHTFREKIEELSDGNVRVLQIKDIRRQHTELKQTDILTTTLPHVNWSGNNKALLSIDSVVLPARGDYYKASTFKSSDKVIASSQLLIITLKDKSVLPAYLCWAINQKATQHYLNSESRGSNMPMLSTHSLGGMPIHIPSLTTQQKIVELQQLWQQEQQLTQQLIKNREIMLKGMFQQLLIEGDKTSKNGDKQ
ncbi:restriction endonuclease subunit S [Haliea sp. AH-315-K21]|uniref:Type I restriction endonuclease subunit S n=1 Tax=SAR86 cluster bacterium TaxID=2030880 RepID=A0A2A5CIG7_9GAMM|nr:restriction endonuclease subunit S [Haliea sp. AH-315-K21]PCJ43318.1 MAG: type I restriction endonuclease subunit S [SAR86 cluster bacterium]